MRAALGGGGGVQRTGVHLSLPPGETRGGGSSLSGGDHERHGILSRGLDLTGRFTLGPLETDGGMRGDFSAKEKIRRLYREVAAHSIAAPLAAAAALTIGALAVRRFRDDPAVPVPLGLGAFLLNGKSTTSLTTQR